MVTFTFSKHILAFHPAPQRFLSNQMLPIMKMPRLLQPANTQYAKSSTSNEWICNQWTLC